MKGRYVAHAIFFLLLVAFIASRFVSLDADPPVAQWAPGIGEEGFWGAPARNQVLFGDWRIDEYTTQHLIMTPLYSAMLLPIFKQFGVGLFQFRLLSAIFGTLSIVLLYFYISRESRRAALLTVIFLFLNDSFFSHNRLGLVETTLTFFITLSAISFLLAKDNKFLIFLSGTIFAIATFVKIYGLFFILIVPFLYYVNIRKGHIKNNVKNHAKNILYFALGALLVCAILAIFFYLPELDKVNSFGGTMGQSLKGRVIAENVFNLIISPFFASLSTAILFIFSLLYLLQLKKPLAQVPNYQLLGIALFFVTFVASLLTTFSIRRLIPLLIPTAILAAAYLVDSKNTDKLQNTNTNALILALFISILAQSVFFEFGIKHYFAATLLLFTSLSLVSVLIKRSKIAAHLDYARLAICVASFTLFVGAFKAILNVFTAASFTLPAILAACATCFVYFTLYEKNFGSALVFVYLIFNIIIIGSAIFYPAYSIKETSAKLSDMVGNSIVTGPPAYQLAYEGNYLPLWYSPHYALNSNVNRDKKDGINYLITKDNFDNNYVHLRPSEVNATYIGAFSILRDQMAYHIYKIN